MWRKIKRTTDYPGSRGKNGRWDGVCVCVWPIFWRPLEVRSCHRPSAKEESLLVQDFLQAGMPFLSPKGILMSNVSISKLLHFCWPPCIWKIVYHASYNAHACTHPHSRTYTEREKKTERHAGMQAGRYLQWQPLICHDSLQKYSYW